MATECLTLRVKPGSIFSPVSEQGKALLKAQHGTLNQAGANSGSFAQQDDDPTVLWSFINWNHLSDHENFEKQSYYKDTIMEAVVLSEGMINLYHVNFDPFPPTTVLGAGEGTVTEYVEFLFHGSISERSRAAFAKAVSDNLQTSRSQDLLAASSGWAVEGRPTGKEGEPDQILYVAALAWKTRKAYQDTMGSQWRRFLKDQASFEGLVSVRPLAFTGYAYPK